MSDADNAESKSLKTLFLIGFILIAAWGGWALGRMGSDRARLKNDAESAVTSGTGVVRELPPPVEATKPPAEPARPAETASVPEKTTPAAVTTPAKGEAEDTPDDVAPVSPPKLVLHSVPSAEITLKNADGIATPYLTDTAGLFRSESLPAGRYSVTVAHADYKVLEVPATFELKPGETTETTVVPETKPASLIIVADDGATVFLDGKKVGGGGAVMLGSVPSKKRLALRVASAAGAAREESLTLAPRENKMLDLRSPEAIAAAKQPAPEDKPVVATTDTPSADDAAKLAAIADKTNPAETKPDAPVGPERTLEPAAPVTPPVAPPPAAAVTLTVNVVSADAGAKLIAFTGGAPGKPPMPVGKAGALKFVGLDAPTILVKCVRTFGAVSVCEASQVGPLQTPAPAEVTF